jgi:hypothetical protein
MEVMK